MENETESAGSAASAHRAAEMPLFPLNVVLFPQMPLKLHIFEGRYKEMVNRCLEGGCPFGIVLVTEVPAPGAERTREVGCSARIAHVERLADGRMNILVIGERRFRILDTHERRSYRTGIITPIADGPDGPPDLLAPLAGEVREMLKEFLGQALALAGQKRVVFELPDGPEALSFAAARVLPIPNEEKQDLLETTDTGARLRSEKDLLAREIARIREAIRQAVPEPITVERFAGYRCSN